MSEFEKKMINVRLSPELWKRAKSAAGERGQTLERWVTNALETHISETRGADGVSGGSSVGSAAGAPSDLAWRVSALEQAVDYLASQMGAGFPDRSPAADATDAASGNRA